jgi:glutathione S-transferase
MPRSSSTIRLVAPECLHPVRLAFCIGGVAFEDDTLAISENTSDRNVELVVDGESLTRPEAMLRCAGRLSGLYPVTSPGLALQVDEILHALSEVQAKMIYPEGAPADDKEIPEESLAKSIIPGYASLIEARLERLSGVLAISAASGEMLIHEIAVFCWVEAVRDLGLNEEVDKHKCILEVVSKVEKHSRETSLKVRQCGNAFPKLKLTYFPFPGRAEPIRLALFIAGISFEDERIGADELEQRRSSLPFNQLPVLEVDGDVMSQALAILRYVGTLGGLYSSSDTKAAFRIDEVFSLVDEFYSSYAWNASYSEKDPRKQKKLRCVLANETLPKTLSFIEKRVAEWKGCWSVGGRITVADLAIYSLVWTFQSGRISDVPVSVVAPYTRLLRIYHAVRSHPKVQEWTAMQH